MIYVNSVNVSPKSVALKLGEWFYNARVDICPTEADCKEVVWHSENSSIASVNASNGYICANGEGTTRIYATATDGSKCTDFLTVTISSTISVGSVTLNRSKLSLEEGQKATLKATVCPENANNKNLVWASSNNDIATVCDGVVTAVAKGSAVITATAQDGSGKSSGCDVVVTEDILVSSVTVCPLSKTMNIGDSAYLYETICPNNATKQYVKWSSNKTDVVTVNPDTGLVMAQGAGTAIITAIAQDGSDKKGYCNITVNSPISVNGIQLCPDSLDMIVGDVACLCTTIIPNNATNQSVIWHSSNESVVTVGTYSGEITARKAGFANITATTVDGAHCDCATIRVFEPYVKELRNSCGFSSEEANLIRKLYDKVDSAFVCESVMLRAWKCARLLSEFCFDYITTFAGISINKWDDVAGSVTTQENRKTYFIDILGYTESEYNTLHNGLLRNRENANKNHDIIDFTHMQYALAARLAYTLELDGAISNIGTGLYTGNYGIYTNEEISYLAGWFGDAVLTNIYGVGINILKNDDYMADLDAENIYCLIIQGNSAIDAINKYYTNITSSNTRADIFLQNISYNTVKGKIFYELIDAQLYMSMANTSNPIEMNRYSNLINDEQYHFDIIKSRYPDTYDFLKSLIDRRSTMAHYQ